MAPLRVAEGLRERALGIDAEHVLTRSNKDLALRESGRPTLQGTDREIVISPGHREGLRAIGQALQAVQPGGWVVGEPRREEGDVEPNRERFEDFIQRYGFAENRVFRVLAVALAILLVLRVLRKLAVPVVIGAILVVGGWLLLGPGLPATSGDSPPIPRCVLSTSCPQLLDAPLRTTQQPVDEKAVGVGLSPSPLSWLPNPPAASPASPRSGTRA